MAQENLHAIMVNDKGFIVNINTAFETAYGYTKTDLVGKPLSIIIPENLRHAHDIGFSRFLKTEKPTLLGQPLQLTIQNAAGAVLMAEHNIYAEKIDNEWVFVASIQVISGKT